MNNKPIYKKWWFWFLVVIVIAFIYRKLGPEEEISKDSAATTASQEHVVSKQSSDNTTAATATEAPTTAVPVTEAPTTTVPVTEAPTTTVPVTEAPTEPVQTVYTLSAGSYVVGVDIPAGRFKLTGISGQGNIMSSDYDGLKGLNSAVLPDSNGTPTIVGIFSSYSISKGAYLYISQTGVIQLDYVSITSPCTGRSYSETPAYELVSGIYTVGEDIEPGAYKAVATSGQGNFIAGDFLEGGANEALGVETNVLFNKEFSNVILKEGDIVEITLTLHLSLYKGE
nr:hypothetical protein [Lachnospiraceae bacterium]